MKILESGQLPGGEETRELINRLVQDVRHVTISDEELVNHYWVVATPDLGRACYVGTPESFLAWSRDQEFNSALSSGTGVRID